MITNKGHRLYILQGWGTYETFSNGATLVIFQRNAEENKIYLNFYLKIMIFIINSYCASKWKQK